MLNQNRKLRRASEYAELREEVERALQANGAEAFRTECLRPAGPATSTLTVPPFYEEFGERQVASGRYAEVIRYQTHVLPLRQALEAHAGIRLTEFPKPT